MWAAFVYVHRTHCTHGHSFRFVGFNLASSSGYIGSFDSVLQARQFARVLPVASYCLCQGAGFGAGLFNGQGANIANSAAYVLPTTEN